MKKYHNINQNNLSIYYYINNNMDNRVLNNIIKNYDDLSIYDKYNDCIDQLTNIEKEMIEYEKTMLEMWDEIEMNFNFKNKYDYYNFIISTPKYNTMIDIKNILIDHINKNYNEIKALEAII